MKIVHNEAYDDYYTAQRKFPNSNFIRDLNLKTRMFLKKMKIVYDLFFAHTTK